MVTVAAERLAVLREIEVGDAFAGQIRQRALSLKLDRLDAAIETEREKPWREECQASAERYADLRGAIEARWNLRIGELRNFNKSS